MLAKSCLQNVSGNWCLSLLDDIELHFFQFLNPKHINSFKLSLYQLKKDPIDSGT